MSADDRTATKHGFSDVHVKSAEGKMNEFCDLDCKYATFPKSDSVDGSRNRRTFVGLYCARKKTLVHKNLPCSDKTVKKQ